MERTLRTVALGVGLVILVVACVFAPETSAEAYWATPDAITVQATGPSGAVVTFPTPTALDAFGQPFALNCAPASGSLFPVGITIVTCTGTDPYGFVSSTGFPVTVTAAPAVAVTGQNMSVPATSAYGAVVVYAPPVVLDSTGQAVPLTCGPASTSILPVGTTTITCSGTDQFGLLTIATFTVTVTPFVAPPTPVALPCMPATPPLPPASGVVVSVLPPVPAC